MSDTPRRQPMRKAAARRVACSTDRPNSIIANRQVAAERDLAVIPAAFLDQHTVVSICYGVRTTLLRATAAKPSQILPRRKSA